MKKAFSRLGGFLAVLLMTCAVCLSPAAAAASESELGESAAPEVCAGDVQLSEDDIAAVSMNNSCNASSKTAGKDFFIKCEGTRWGYNEAALRSNGEKRQRFYDRLLDAMIEVWNCRNNLSAENVVDEYNYELVYVAYSDIGLTREEAKETYNAFLCDNPIFYFIAKKYNTNRVTYKNGKIDYGMMFFTYKEYLNAATRAECQSKIEQYLAQAASIYKKNDSAYNNVTRLHDKILDTLTYSSSSGTVLYSNYYHSAHNIMGGLRYGKGVCESYAKLFHLINNYCGLDSIYVVGKGTDSSGNSGNHVWNLVKLDDYYYCFDSTWNDNQDKRKYFASGTDTFAATHTPQSSGWNSEKQFFYGLPYNIASQNYDVSRYSSHQHSFSDWKVTKRPTCTEDGSEMRKCKSCSCVQTRSVCANGHTFRDKTVSYGCTSAAEINHTCAVCGYSYSEQTSKAKGHQYADQVIAPTCTQDGYTLHVCKVCGDTKKDTIIKAKGHSFASETISPTCTEDGYTLKKCLNCGYIVKENIVKAKGHSYWSKTVDPTCTEPGYTEHSCMICGDKYIDSQMPAKGHLFRNRVIAPTAQSGGRTEHFCTVCGILTVDSYKAPLGGFLLATIRVALPGSVDYNELKATVYTADGTKLFKAKCDDNGVVYHTETPADGSYAVELSLPGCAKRRCFFEIKNGVSRFSEVLLCARGDLDGNGKVNLTDLLIMQRLTAGWKVKAVYPETADCDGNGKITLDDLTLLQKKISGWKVVLQ